MPTTTAGNVIPPNPNDVAEENDNVDREKRRSWGKLKELLQPKNRFFEPSLGSTQDTAAKKPASNSTSWLHEFAKAMTTGKGFSAFPLMSPRKTTQTTVDTSIPSSENTEELNEFVAAVHTVPQTSDEPISCTGPECIDQHEPVIGMAGPETSADDTASNIMPNGNTVVNENAEPNGNTVLNENAEQNGNTMPNEPIIGAKGPVVQPTFLMDDTNSKKPFGYSPYRITSKQMKETAAIRNEINNAVRHHIYVHSSSEAKKMPAPKATVEPTTQPPYKNRYYSNIFDFWDNLIGKSRTMFKIQPMFKKPTILGDARSDFSYVQSSTGAPSTHKFDVVHPPQDEQLTVDDRRNQATVDEMMMNAAAKTRSEGFITNTVDSFLNNAQQPVYEMSQTRESLHMKSITEDMRFKIGENVIEWKTLQRNHQESHALIGLTKTSIVLVLEKSGTYTLQSEIPLFAPIYFTTVTHWNQTSNAIEGVVIVATENEIVFLRVNEAMTEMQSFWMWPLYKKAQYVKYLELDNSPTLMLIANKSVNIYRFDFGERESYLRESFQLSYPAKMASLVHTGHETFLCFPQKSFVTIYKYTQNRFKHFSRIDAENAEMMTAFEMGGFSYIAIGGAQPKILQYHRGDFRDQTILAQSWGYVEQILPVPARTYRDDLILLIQHRVTYGTHDHSYLEALIWNGRAFDAALTVPCYVNEMKSPIGMGCMLDGEREEGILGATVFQRNRTISILVPRFDAPSGLFDLEIELMPGRFSVSPSLSISRK